MILKFRVSEQTISALNTKSVPRIGSKDYLIFQFSFSNDWDGLTKTAYLQRDSVSVPIEIKDGLVEIPEWFTEQESFNVTLFGTDGTKEVPTNVVAIKLEKSNDLWVKDAPEPTPSWITKLIDLSNHPPIPGENGFWLLWDPDVDEYVESQLPLPVTELPTRLSQFENDLFYNKKAIALTLRKEDFLFNDQEGAFIYESSPSLSWFSEESDIFWKLNITANGETTSMTRDEASYKDFSKIDIGDGSYAIRYICLPIVIVNNLSIMSNEPADKFGIVFSTESVPDDFTIEIYRVDEKRLSDDVLPENLKRIITCNITDSDEQNLTYTTDINVDKFSSELMLHPEKYNIHVGDIRIDNDYQSLSLQYVGKNEQELKFSGIANSKASNPQVKQSTVFASLYVDSGTDGSSYVALKLMTPISGMYSTTYTLSNDVSAYSLDISDFKYYRMLKVYIDRVNAVGVNDIINIYYKRSDANYSYNGITVNQKSLVQNMKSHTVVSAFLFNPTNDSNFIFGYYADSLDTSSSHSNRNSGKSETYRDAKYWSNISLGKCSAGTTVRIEVFE